MGLKHISDWKLFESDAFARVGKKLWVDLKASGVPNIDGGDERVYYFRRFEPENILPSEMDELRKMFNEFNGFETNLESEIPSDNGYRIKVGSFSVKLNCGGRMVPFNFHRRADEWWLVNCKYRGGDWVGNRRPDEIDWCEGTKLYGYSVVLCDSIEGIKEFLDDYSSSHKSYSGDVFSRLFTLRSKKSDWWEYLGERNGVEWSENIDRLLSIHSYRPMDEKEKLQISEWLRPVLSDSESAKGRNPNTNSLEDWVCYNPLKSVQNSRFENCWFTKKSKDSWGFEYAWDMCVQGFSDEWYLVNIGDGRGSFNYWFRVDTFEGLHNLIEKVFSEK